MISYQSLGPPINPFDPYQSFGILINSLISYQSLGPLSISLTIISPLIPYQSLGPLINPLISYQSLCPLSIPWGPFHPDPFNLQTPSPRWRWRSSLPPSLAEPPAIPPITPPNSIMTSCEGVSRGGGRGQNVGVAYRRGRVEARWAWPDGGGRGRRVGVARRRSVSALWAWPGGAVGVAWEVGVASGPCCLRSPIGGHGGPFAVDGTARSRGCPPGGSPSGGSHCPHRYSGGSERCAPPGPSPPRYGRRSAADYGHHRSELG